MFNIVFVILISVSFISSAEEKPKKVTLLSLSKCPVKNGKEIIDQITLNNIDDEQSMSMSVNVDKALGEEEKIAIQCSILYDGEYKHFFSAKDLNVCEILQYVGPAWAEFRAKLNPPVEDSCNIDPGRYDMENYPLPAKIPGDNVPTGQLKIHLVLYSGEEDDVACVEYEVILE